LQRQYLVQVLLSLAASVTHGAYAVLMAEKPAVFGSASRMLEASLHLVFGNLVSLMLERNGVKAVLDVFVEMQ
jgi:hypothetical protein